MMTKMKTQNKVEKMKDFVLKYKLLSALLVLDLILFILGNIIYSIATLFIFILFITTTYLIVLFEKYNTKIFIIAIALFIIISIGILLMPRFIFGLFPVILLLIIPQSFLLLILKHFAIFEKQNAIVKTLIIDAIILIPFIMFFGFTIPSL